MSTNLVESIKSIFTSEVISKTSTHLGENESAVNRAINAMVPVLLGGLLDKSSSPSGANTVAQWAQNEVAPGSFRNPLQSFETSTGSKGSDDDRLLQNLFGPRTNTVTDVVSNYAAIRPVSTRSLWGMIGPVILGFIGNYAAANKIDPAGIASLLNNQKENIRQAVPTGLNLAAVMSGNEESHATHSPHIRKAAPAVHREIVVEEEGSGIGWLVLILLFALLGAGAWYMSHDSSQHEAAAPHGSPAEEHATTSAAASPAAHASDSVTARESLKVRLANGTEINAYRGGIEEKLVMFLNTDYKALAEDSLKQVWFDFDNLNFKTASAELTPESQQQVDNLTAILKAYPKATLKIGGYTDKVGDEASNKTLSTARANAVKDALTKAGVGAQVTGAEGYGSSFAKYPATASEAERLTDRRVSVSVR